MKTNVFAEKSGPVAAKIPLCCGLRLILPEQKWIRDSAFGSFNGLTGGCAAYVRCRLPSSFRRRALFLSGS